MTKKEREQDNLLREQLRGKKENRGVSWFIKKGKLCHNGDFRNYYH